MNDEGQGHLGNEKACGAENKWQWLKLQIILKSHKLRLLVAINCTHQNGLVEQNDYLLWGYKAFSWNQIMEDSRPQGQGQIKTGYMASSLSMLLSTPFIFLSPQRPVFLLLGWQGEEYGDQQFLSLYSTVWASGDSTDSISNTRGRNFGQATSCYWEHGRVTL